MLSRPFVYREREPRFARPRKRAGRDRLHRLAEHAFAALTSSFVWGHVADGPRKHGTRRESMAPGVSVARRGEDASTDRLTFTASCCMLFASRVIRLTLENTGDLAHERP